MEYDANGIADNVTPEERARLGPVLEDFQKKFAPPGSGRKVFLDGQPTIIRIIAENPAAAEKIGDDIGSLGNSVFHHPPSGLLGTHAKGTDALSKSYQALFTNNGMISIQKATASEVDISFGLAGSTMPIPSWQIEQSGTDKTSAALSDYLGIKPGAGKVTFYQDQDGFAGWMPGLEITAKSQEAAEAFVKHLKNDPNIQMAAYCDKASHIFLNLNTCDETDQNNKFVATNCMKGADSELNAKSKNALLAELHKDVDPKYLLPLDATTSTSVAQPSMLEEALHNYNKALETAQFSEMMVKPDEINNILAYSKTDHGGMKAADWTQAEIHRLESTTALLNDKFSNSQVLDDTEIRGASVRQQLRYNELNAMAQHLHAMGANKVTRQPVDFSAEVNKIDAALNSKQSDAQLVHAFKQQIKTMSDDKRYDALTGMNFGDLGTLSQPTGGSGHSGAKGRSAS